MDIMSTDKAGSSVVSLPEEKEVPLLQGMALASVLIGLLLTLLLEALDMTVVGTAMPRIVGSLHGLERYSWVVTAYLLTSVTVIPLVGKFSDQFGRKGFLIIGTMVFLLGSILAGLAQSIEQLIVFRALQGLGAGMGTSLAFTAVADLFPPGERARWQGLFGAVFGISSLVGPELGGWIADHGPLLGSLVTDQTRWRWIFYLNLPLGVAALLMLAIWLPAHLSVPRASTSSWAALRRVDVLGAVLSAAATICLLLGLTWGSSHSFPWNSPQVVGILVGAAIILVLFFLVESRVAEPVIPLRIFRNRPFTLAVLISLLQGMAMLGLVLYLPLFFQGVLGFSSTATGALMTPQAVGTVVGSMLAGFAINLLKRSRVVAIAGSFVLLIGSLLITQMSPLISAVEAVAYTALAGIGLGTFFTILTLSVQNAVPPTQLGVATGLGNYLRQMGLMLGGALVGAVVTAQLPVNLTAHLPSTAADKLVLATALQHGFALAVVFCLATFLLTFFLKDVPMSTSSWGKPDNANDTHQAPAVEENITIMAS
jgi:EmrB/QacA subfamily drug resistance transporter